MKNDPLARVVLFLYNIHVLNKDYRLAKKRDFDLLLKHGIFINGENLSIRVLNLAQNKKYFPKKENINNFEKQLRIAFSVGLKISKKAVERNRVKRQMSEAVRLLMKEQGVKTGFYLLFIAKPKILEKSYAEISEEINLLLKKGNLFLG